MKIINFLKKHPWSPVKDIEKRVPFKRGKVYAELKILKEEGKVISKTSVCKHPSPHNQILNREVFKCVK